MHLQRLKNIFLPLKRKKALSLKQITILLSSDSLLPTEDMKSKVCLLVQILCSASNCFVVQN